MQKNIRCNLLNIYNLLKCKEGAYISLKIYNKNVNNIFKNICEFYFKYVIIS